jgi:hypothetical protein
VRTHLKVLRDFPDKTLEGQLADEEFGGLLVATDFTESDGTGPEAMGLLDTTSCGLQCSYNGNDNVVDVQRKKGRK